MKIKSTLSVVKCSWGTIAESGTEFSSVTIVDTSSFLDTDYATGFNVSKMDVRTPDNKPNLELARKISEIRKRDQKNLFVDIEFELAIITGSKDTKTVICGVIDKSAAK